MCNIGKTQHVCKELKPLLDHKGILKLIHDSHNTAALLKRFGNISEIQCVYDTQLPMEAITGHWDLDFEDMLGTSDVSNTYNSNAEPHTSDELEERPLGMNLKKSFLEYARYLHEAFEKHLANIVDHQGKFKQILNASHHRIRCAAQVGGERSLCFCLRGTPQKYKIQSYECMQEIYPSQVVKPSPIVVLNDAEPLLGLLPEDIKMWNKLPTVSKANTTESIVSFVDTPPRQIDRLV